MFLDASCLISKQDYCGDLGGDKLSFGRKTPFCSVLTNESKLRKAGPKKKTQVTFATVVLQMVIWICTRKRDQLFTRSSLIDQESENQDQA